MIPLFYSDSSCQILRKGKLNDPILVYASVKQECLLSSIVFNIVLDEVMKKVTDKNCGIRGHLIYLEDLDYADDICLLCHIYTDIENKLARLIAEAGTVGLSINTKKTKSLEICTNNIQPLSWWRRLMISPTWEA